MAGCRIGDCQANASVIIAVAQNWLGNGGTQKNLVAAVAVAGAESSLNPYALSDAGAIGYWQIMPFHAATYGFTVQQLYEPDVNAYIAVKLSNDGDNWSAWDVAYAAGEGLRDRYYIHNPEVGSEAWKCLDCVSSIISGPGGMSPQDLPPPPVGAPIGIQALPGVVSPSNPPDLPDPTQASPPPYIPPDIVTPDVGEPYEDFDGFDNIVRYYKRDLTHLHDVDVALIREITRLIGGYP